VRAVAVPALCHVCGAPATAACSMCGRPTCDRDMERFSRMCVSCLAPRRGPKA